MRLCLALPLIALLTRTGMVSMFSSPTSGTRPASASRGSPSDSAAAASSKPPTPVPSLTSSGASARSPCTPARGPPTRGRGPATGHDAERPSRQAHSKRVYAKSRRGCQGRCCVALSGLRRQAGDSTGSTGAARLWNPWLAMCRPLRGLDAPGSTTWRAASQRLLIHPLRDRRRPSRLYRDAPYGPKDTF